MYSFEALISIHTPAKGVTREHSGADSGIGISIHTPAKGVTSLMAYDTKELAISIHTPAKGVTVDDAITKFTEEFQSTLPRRE